MNGTMIGVAAALLLGGATIYGVGQVVFDGDDDAASLAASDDGAARSDAVIDASGGGRGVPSGTRSVDFASGADGDDRTALAKQRAAEAKAEAERLALFGTSDGERDDGARARGLRDAAPAQAAGTTDRRRADTDVDRLLAEIAETSGDDTVAAPGGTRVAGRKLVDKPDTGGFQTTKLVDKPDQGGFVASADTQRFDPCQKSDGTQYVGPGTALNPFAENDPCLPQATGQAFEVASLSQPLLDPTPPLVDVQVENARLVPVDVARPFVSPPPPIGTGSDYRG